MWLLRNLLDEPPPPPPPNVPELEPRATEAEEPDDPAGARRPSQQTSRAWAAIARSIPGASRSRNTTPSATGSATASGPPFARSEREQPIDAKAELPDWRQGRRPAGIAGGADPLEVRRLPAGDGPQGDGLRPGPVAHPAATSRRPTPWCRPSATVTTGSLPSSS